MTDSFSLVQKTNASPAHVLQNRNFRLLWIGEGVSLLGDQFYLVALPWLVLSLTGNPLAVGMVLAAGGIPRALFMLVGGALTDRFTPRRLMINSNAARMALTALLAILVATNTTPFNDARFERNQGAGNSAEWSPIAGSKDLLERARKMLAEGVLQRLADGLMGLGRAWDRLHQAVDDLVNVIRRLSPDDELGDV